MTIAHPVQFLNVIHVVNREMSPLQTSMTSSSSDEPHKNSYQRVTADYLKPSIGQKSESSCHIIVQYGFSRKLAQDGREKLNLQANNLHMAVNSSKCWSSSSQYKKRTSAVSEKQNTAFIFLTKTRSQSILAYTAQAQRHERTKEFK